MSYIVKTIFDPFKVEAVPVPNIVTVTCINFLKIKDEVGDKPLTATEYVAFYKEKYNKLPQTITGKTRSWLIRHGFISNVVTKEKTHHNVKAFIIHWDKVQWVIDQLETINFFGTNNKDIRWIETILAIDRSRDRALSVKDWLLATKAFKAPYASYLMMLNEIKYKKKNNNLIHFDGSHLSLTPYGELVVNTWVNIKNQLDEWYKQWMN